MPFIKGDERINRNGRQPGAPNKATAQALQTVSDVLNGQKEKFINELETLTGRDYCNLYAKLMQMIIPRDTNFNFNSGDPLKDFLKLPRHEQAVIIGEKLNEIENEKDQE